MKRMVCNNVRLKKRELHMEIDVILNSLKSPSWWVLTIFFGLILNVVAPFINRSIESWWGNHSSKRKSIIERSEKRTKARIADSASREIGILEIKLEAIYWAIRIVMLLTIFLVAIQLTFAVQIYLVNLLAIPLALAAFFSITAYWKKLKVSIYIHNEVLKLRKKSNTENA